MATPARKYELTWSDEFDAAAGAGLNPLFWEPNLGDGSDYGIPGWGNSEREWYLAENAAHDGNSNLVITALRLPEDNSHLAYYGSPAEWSSAKYTTFGKVHFQYGRIEARLKLPKGDGTWPAFWMLGTDLPTNPWPACGEIDIMEMRGDLPKRLYGTVHGPNYFGEHGKGRVWDQEIDLTDDFHTYAIDWLPGKISWFLDGEKFHEVSRADVAPDEWVFDHEFYLVMNLAMGGHFTSAIDPSLNSAEFSLDYVRHFSIDGVGAAVINSA